MHTFSQRLADTHKLSPGKQLGHGGSTTTSNLPPTLQVSTLWLLSSCTTFVTTERLLHLEHVQHPLILLLLHILGAVLLQIPYFALIVPKDERYDRFLATFRHGRAWTIPGVLRFCSAAGILPLTYAAMAHIKNPFFLLMIFTAPQHSILFSIRLNRKFDTHTAARVVAILASLFCIYRFDYRLSPQAIFLSLLVLTCAELANYLDEYIAMNDMNDTEASIEQSRNYHTDPPNTLFAALAPFMIVSLLFRDRARADFDISDAPVLFAVNIVAGAVTLLSVGHIFNRFTLNILKEPDFLTAAAFSSLVRVGIFGVAYLIWVRDAVLRSEQLAAFVFLCFSLNSADGAHRQSTTHGNVSESDIYHGIPEAHLCNADGLSAGLLGLEHMLESDDMENSALRGRESSWQSTMTLLFIIATGAVAWALLIYQTTCQPFGQSTFTTPSLDITYQAERALDIVVARYDEPFEDLITTLQPLLQTSTVASLRPRVMIYNKGPDSNQIDLRERVSAFFPGVSDVIAIPRPNIGREGETYLHHLIENWDDLANHTIFTQAAMHNPVMAAKRLQDYFTPETGFLSLSYVDSLCRHCDKCRDDWRWNTPPETVKSIYAQANNGAQCKDIALTYKGQFITSAARIKGGNRQLYQQLLTSLTNMTSEQHSHDYLSQIDHGTSDDDGDELSNPTFGFTLERLWGVIMQCPGGRIADRCPSLISGMAGVRGALEDCQCLDA